MSFKEIIHLIDDSIHNDFFSENLSIDVDISNYSEVDNNINLNTLNNYSDTPSHILARLLRLDDLYNLCKYSNEVEFSILNNDDRNVIHLILIKLQTKWKQQRQQFNRKIINIDNNNESNFKSPSSIQVIDVINLILNKIVNSMNYSETENNNVEQLQIRSILKQKDKYDFDIIDYAIATNAVDIISYFLTKCGIINGLNSLKLTSDVMYNSNNDLTIKDMERYIRHAILLNRAEIVSIFAVYYNNTNNNQSNLNSNVDIITYAIQHEKNISLRTLLLQPIFESSINSLDLSNITPLETAIIRFCTSISQSDSVISAAIRTKTIIHYENTIRILLRYNANPLKIINNTFYNDDFNEDNNRIDNYFALCARGGCIEAIRLLLLASPTVNSASNTSSFYQSVASIRNGYFVFGSAVFNSNPLVHCLRGGNAKTNEFNMLEFLLNSSPFIALVNYIDENGNTPLSIACYRDNKECVDLLISHGAIFHLKIPKTIDNSNSKQNQNVIINSRIEVNSIMNVCTNFNDNSTISQRLGLDNNENSIINAKKLQNQLNILSNSLDKYFHLPRYIVATNSIVKKIELYPKFKFNRSNSVDIFQYFKKEKERYYNKLLSMNGINKHSIDLVVLELIPSSVSNIYNHWWHDAVDAHDWELLLTLVSDIVKYDNNYEDIIVKAVDEGATAVVKEFIIKGGVVGKTIKHLEIAIEKLDYESFIYLLCGGIYDISNITFWNHLLQIFNDNKCKRKLNFSTIRTRNHNNESETYPFNNKSKFNSELSLENKGDIILNVIEIGLNFVNDSVEEIQKKDVNIYSKIIKNSIFLEIKPKQQSLINNKDDDSIISEINHSILVCPDINNHLGCIKLLLKDSTIENKENEFSISVNYDYNSKNDDNYTIYYPVDINNKIIPKILTSTIYNSIEGLISTNVKKSAIISDIEMLYITGKSSLYGNFLCDSISINNLRTSPTSEYKSLINKLIGIGSCRTSSCVIEAIKCILNGDFLMNFLSSCLNCSIDNQNSSSVNLILNENNSYYSTSNNNSKDVTDDDGNLSGEDDINIKEYVCQIRNKSIIRLSNATRKMTSLSTLYKGYHVTSPFIDQSLDNFNLCSLNIMNKLINIANISTSISSLKSDCEVVKILNILNIFDDKTLYVHLTNFIKEPLSIGYYICQQFHNKLDFCTTVDEYLLIFNKYDSIIDALVIDWMKSLYIYVCENGKLFMDFYQVLDSMGLNNIKNEIGYADCLCGVVNDSISTEENDINEIKQQDLSYYNSDYKGRVKVVSQRDKLKKIKLEKKLAEIKCEKENIENLQKELFNLPLCSREWLGQSNNIVSEYLKANLAIEEISQIEKNIYINMISFELSTREFKEIKDLNASNYNDNEIFSKEILEKYKEKNKKYKYCSKNMIPKICLPLVCLDNSFIKLTNVSTSILTTIFGKDIIENITSDESSEINIGKLMFYLWKIIQENTLLSNIIELLNILIVQFDEIATLDLYSLDMNDINVSKINSIPSLNLNVIDNNKSNITTSIYPDKSILISNSSLSISSILHMKKSTLSSYHLMVSLKALIKILSALKIETSTENMPEFSSSFTTSTHIYETNCMKIDPMRNKLIVNAIKSTNINIIKKVISKKYYKSILRNQFYNNSSISVAVITGAIGNMELLKVIFGLGFGYINKGSYTFDINEKNFNEDWNSMYSLLTGYESLELAVISSIQYGNNYNHGEKAKMIIDNVNIISNNASLFSVGDWNRYNYGREKTRGVINGYSYNVSMKNREACGLLMLSLGGFDNSSCYISSSKPYYYPSIIDIAASNHCWELVNEILNKDTDDNNNETFLSIFTSTKDTSNNLYLLLHASAIDNRIEIFDKFQNLFNKSIRNRDENEYDYYRLISILQRHLFSIRNFSLNESVIAPDYLKMKKKRKDIMTLKYFLSSQLSLTEINSYKHSVLHDAILNNNEANVINLLQFTYDVYKYNQNQSDNSGESKLIGYYDSGLLHYATFMNMTKVVNILLLPPWNCNPNMSLALPMKEFIGYLWNPIQIAAYKGYNKCLTDLLSKINCSKTDIKSLYNLALFCRNDYALNNIITYWEISLKNENNSVIDTNTLSERYPLSWVINENQLASFDQSILLSDCYLLFNSSLDKSGNVLDLITIRHLNYCIRSRLYLSFESMLRIYIDGLILSKNDNNTLNNENINCFLIGLFKLITSSFDNHNPCKLVSDDDYSSSPCTFYIDNIPKETNPALLILKHIKILSLTPPCINQQLMSPYTFNTIMQYITNTNKLIQNNSKSNNRYNECNLRSRNSILLNKILDSRQITSNSQKNKENKNIKENDIKLGKYNIDIINKLKALNFKEKTVIIEVNGKKIIINNRKK